MSNKILQLNFKKTTFETRLHVYHRTIMLTTYLSPRSDYEIAATTNIVETITVDKPGTAFLYCSDDGTNMLPGDTIVVRREITQTLTATDSMSLYYGTDLKNLKMMHKHIVSIAKKHLKTVGDEMISLFKDLEFIPFAK